MQNDKSKFSMPLVSVIIPVYNAERYIGRAIKSALSQTYRDIEIIVVDDGSTDRTAEIIQSFKDPRIRCIYQQNKGLGSARNAGIRESRGKYITNLDADDEYLPEKVAKQVEFFERNPEYKAVYCNTLQFYSDAPDRLFKKRGPHPSGDIFPDLLHSSVINPNTVMLAKEVYEKIGMVDERRDSPEDWELWLRIAGAGYKFGYVDSALVKVEMRKDSKTTPEVNLQAKKYLLEIFEKLFSAMSSQERERHNTCEILHGLKWKIAILCLINNNKEELAKITPGISSIRTRFLVLAAKRIPAPFRKATLTFLWRLYQRRNFMPIHHEEI